ncbi:MAG: DNA repair exonuclease [Verrucomicrobia bacterium]|nr:DNA repair exonuclease [Verrucomicrobiota bacterium]MCH8510342.1 DNA repair exonuclease [Kiritimatiellia bacterium]
MNIFAMADLHLGKPFGRFQPEKNRTLIRRARLNVLQKLPEWIRREEVDLVLIAGDVFDSPRPDADTMTQSLQLLGQAGVPVLLIPGNHDAAEAGSVWYSSDFQRLCPDNLIVALEAKPIEVAGAVVLPCPLRRRHEREDLLGWLQDQSLWSSLPPECPRIVLAHGTVVNFHADDDGAEHGINHLDLDRLPEAELDAVVLGDWHRQQQVTPKAWYTGTPEMTGFAANNAQVLGQGLLCRVERGKQPQFTPVPTGTHRWEKVEVALREEVGFASLEEKLADYGMNDVIGLKLTGTLGLEDRSRLDQLLVDLNNRLLRCEVEDQILLEPGEGELEKLSESGHPLVAATAMALRETQLAGGSESEVAARALRLLYCTCSQLQNKALV